MKSRTKINFRIKYVLGLFLLFSFLFFFLNISNAQIVNASKIDSLHKVLNKSKQDTSKALLLCDLAYETHLYNPKIALKYAKKALSISNKINYEKGRINAFYQLALIYKGNGDYASALMYLIRMEEKAKKIGDKKSIVNANSNMGSVYIFMKNNAKAKQHYEMALKIAEITGDSSLIVSSLSNIGHIYSSMQEYEKAMEINLKILPFLEKTNNQYGLGILYTNIAQIFYRQKKYDVAIRYYTLSKEASLAANDKSSVSISLNNIGSILHEEGKYLEALDFYKQSLKIATDINDNRVMLASSQSISEIYAILGNYEAAYKYHLQYSSVNDILLNEEKTKAIAEMSAKYDIDKKQKEIELLNKEKEKQEAVTIVELKRKNTIMFFVFLGFLLVVIFSAFLFRRFKITKAQKLIIEKKNKEINDSISYAKRIQEAILPTGDEFSIAFPESFILYKPKDIVSGDFYWIGANPNRHPSIENKNGWKLTNPLIAAVDCTGHGVPGSLMSMMGNSLLNKIADTYKISKPNEILNQLRIEIVNSLKQNTDNNNKDGMDMALCAFYDDKIEFSGANNPLYIVRKDGNFEKIKGDKMPIGFFTGEQKSFTNHEIKTEKGDCVYIFTDGYPDQFGGKENKKFKYTPLEKLLCSIHKKSFADQKQILNDTIEKWKGNNEQTDDILIIGIRV
jgi:serine phosphatase RsbU (regulator of sigma subunit)/Tfp pilus assembly protein PilF